MAMKKLSEGRKRVIIETVIHRWIAEGLREENGSDQVG